MPSKVSAQKLQKTPLSYRSVSLGLISEDNEYYQHCWWLCFYSARLYNVGLFNIRQQWLDYGYFLSKPENFHWLKHNPNYKALMSDQAQQTLALIYRDMKSFFEGLKQAKTSGEGRTVRLPSYKPNEAKKGLALCTTYGRSLRNTKKQDEGFVLRDRETLIPFSQDFKYQHKGLGEGIPLKLPQSLVGKVINEVKIIPTFKYGKQHFEIHVTYGVKHKQMRESKGHYLSIDMGLKNTMACFDSFGESFIIQDRDILAFNTRYNKKQDNLKSQKDNLMNRLKDKTLNQERKAIIEYHIEGIKKSQTKLAKQRKDKIKDWLNRASLVIARYALDANIDTVVVGYNKNQKQNINIGKKNNRRFVELPFGLLRQRLKDRLNEFGIAYIEQEESYTSKCSFLDKEFPRKHKKGEYLGNRVNRGLFKTSNQTLINADINAAANILVKHLHSRGILEQWYNHSFERASQGIVNFPCLVSSIQFTQRHQLSTNTVWTELTKSSIL